MIFLLKTQWEIAFACYWSHSAKEKVENTDLLLNYRNNAIIGSFGITRQLYNRKVRTKLNKAVGLKLTNGMA